jgi:hypothetical protein
VQIEHAPAAFGLTAHSKSVSGHVIFRRIKRIIVGIPNRIAVSLGLVHLDFVAEVGGVFKESLS